MQFACYAGVTKFSKYNVVFFRFRLGIASPEFEPFNGRPQKRKRTETPLNTPVLSQGRSHVVRSTVKTTANKSKAAGPIRILEVIPGKVVRIENSSNSV